MLTTKKKKLKKKVRAEVAELAKAEAKHQFFHTPAKPKTKGFAGAIRSGAHTVIDTLIGPMGQPLAAGAKKLFGWVTGLGTYKIHGQVLPAGHVPQFSKGREYVEISYREYVEDVVTSSTAGSMKVEVYYINPTNSSLFPWLSNMATMFEEWESMGMLAEFKSDSANALNSTNTALGQVALACNYDATQAAWTTRAQLLDSEYVSSDAPAQSFLHPIEVSRKLTPAKIFYTSQTTGTDQNQTTLGILHLATWGMQAASVNVGQLWMTYKFRFFKPKIPGAGGVTTSLHYLPAPGTDSLTVSASTSCSPGSPFGTNPLVYSSGRLLGDKSAGWGKAIVGANSQTITLTFPPGCAGQDYFIYTGIYGTSGGTMSLSYGGSGYDYIQGIGDGAQNNQFCGSSVATIGLVTIRPRDQPAAVTFSVTMAFVVSIANIEFHVWQASPTAISNSVYNPGYSKLREEVRRLKEMVFGPEYKDEPASDPNVPNPPMQIEEQGQVSSTPAEYAIVDGTGHNTPRPNLEDRLRLALRGLSGGGGRC